MTFSCVLALTTIIPISVTSASAANERSLYLYYTHTKETARIVYKRNGQFVQSGINELNQFLRDWRRNEPARMDPQLFDLLWEAYQMAGSDQPIHIVSAYRSPQTNAMLRSQSSGVAENSQHMAGKAIDFFIPGVPISKLREIGFRLQVGGVGYYPNSGSPFVHLDTGSVRAWPRMTTAQLREIFPDGKTLHVPSNGTVLSQEGYRLAQAEWQRCHRVPCNGGIAGGDTRSADSGGSGRNLFDVLFGNNSQPTQTASAAPAPAAAPRAQAAPAPQAQQVATVAIPVTPPARPGTISAATAVPQNIPFAIVEAPQATTQVAALDAAEALAAPTPPAISRSLAELRETTPSAFAATTTASLDLGTPAQAPTPMPRPQFGPPVVAASFAPIRSPMEAAQAQAADDIVTASTNSADDALEGFSNLFRGPILPARTASAEPSAFGLDTREGELFAPDLEHVTEIFLTAEALDSAHFAVLTDPDNADFDPATQPADPGHFQFSQTAALAPGTSFGNSGTIWVRMR